MANVVPNLSFADKVRANRDGFDPAALLEASQILRAEKQAAREREFNEKISQRLHVRAARLDQPVAEDTVHADDLGQMNVHRGGIVGNSNGGVSYIVYG